MKLALFGVSGFIGQRLIEILQKNRHELILFSRGSSDSLQKKFPSTQNYFWTGTTEGDWQKHLEGVDAIINLSGEGIATKRWTSERKKNILSSRTKSTHALVQAIKNLEKKPTVWINASAVGYYGNVPEGEVTEETPATKGFLSETCQKWEDEALKIKEEAPSVRLVLLRIGVVLGLEGGALQKMITPFKLFIGGPLGSGKQWFPWVHRDDIVNIIEQTLKNSDLEGPVNATSPNPLRLKDFCNVLGSVMKRPSWAPVPGFVLKLMLGEMSILLLGGQKAIPQKLIKSGFKFEYPTADLALKNILS